MMNVLDLSTALELEVLNMSDSERMVAGVYSGDLLSWVMTRLKTDFAWITIMSNINSIAVATLADASCIIFTENAEVSEELLNKAKEQGINIFRTAKSTFETSFAIGKIFYGE